MRLLLDTHVAVWGVSDSRRLPSSLRTLIADRDNEVFFSAASIWEIAIKQRLARTGGFPFGAHDAITYFHQAGFEPLSVHPGHAAHVASLPAFHTDPFDRLLVAQAEMGDCRLVTHDRQVAAYLSNALLF